MLFYQVSTGGKRKKDEIYVDSLDFNKKILHTAWHPSENVIAVAATNNLFLLQVNLLKVNLRGRYCTILNILILGRTHLNLSIIIKFYIDNFQDKF